MFYRNSNHVFMIGGTPVGSGVAPVSVVVNIGTRLSLGFTAYDSADNPICSVPPTTGSASASGLPKGSKVVMEYSSEDYWTLNPYISIPRMSGTGHTGDTARYGSTGTLVGYPTSDVNYHIVNFMWPKYFTASSTIQQLASFTASGGGSRSCNCAWPLIWQKGSTAGTSHGCFTDSLTAVRKYANDTQYTSTVTATASVLEPMYCSAFRVSATANVYDGAGWGHSFSVQFNSGNSTGFTTTEQNYDGSANGTMTLTQTNSLSSRTTADMALGLSAHFMAKGSVQTGYVKLLAWYAQGVAR